MRSMEARLRVLLPFLFIVLSLTPTVRAAPTPAPAADDLATLTRDDTAAEAAILAGDVDAALRYFDYSGHEQEAFARASVEYRRARVALRRAVRQTFGGPAWAQAAADLGVDDDEPDPARRSVRRQGDVLYAKMRGARHEVPYVKSDGLWKVSVRDVLLTAVRARFGADVAYEEADLYVLAGKMAKVMQGRAADFSALAGDVRGGRVRSRRELRDAVRRIRGAGKPAPTTPAPAQAPAAARP